MNQRDSIITLPQSANELPKYSKLKTSSSGRNTNNQITNNAFTKCKRFLFRLFRINQMDFEFATWQMVYLFLNPKKVYVYIYIYIFKYHSTNLY